MITAKDYFGFLAGHRLLTPHIEDAAADLLVRVNALLDTASASGVTLEINPITRTLVSGNGSGGWRMPASMIGAPNSAHKSGQAVDVYDPDGDLDDWCLDNLETLEALGLYLEHPAATKGWCHLTTRAPRSGKRVFYP